VATLTIRDNSIFEVYD